MGNNEIKKLLVQTPAAPSAETTPKPQKPSEAKTKKAGEKLANLVLSSFNAYPINPVGGEYVKLSATVFNNGDIETGPFEVKIDKGEKGEEIFRIRNLKPGETRDIKAVLQTDPLKIPVDYKIKAIADSDDRVDESHESDNSKELLVRAAPIPKTTRKDISPPPPMWHLTKEQVAELFPEISTKISQRIKEGETRADLEITHFRPSQRLVEAGRDVWFDIVVVNSGAAETQPFFIELSKDPYRLDKTDVYPADGLKSGEGLLIRDAGPLNTTPSQYPNDYFVKVTVDPAEQIEDIDKNNNSTYEIINTFPSRDIESPKKGSVERV